ncbi:PTS system mannose/fructose/N-acetylgalactosamine-transporter subunit IIB [Sporolactobacillus terrae]|uniref:PTS system mannose/fructose/N-acetylgalactosamine-transporter subunit IIB n=1 Tax=Sporolactobacillus terrae TaxID=269673 RepID=UPI00048E4EF2|nr:PTS sugar transporter subunit IIB [Sporolactobacillus terrae]
MISLLRADDRLVHGLVAVSWTNQVQPSILLVANDKAAHDSMMQMTMKMAKPAGVTMAIKSIEDAKKILNNPKYSDRKIFVVTENIKDAYLISQSVSDVDKVNIGTVGIKYKKEEAVSVLPQIKMTSEEFEYANKLEEKGAEVFAQVSPTQEKLNFKGILKAFNK